MKAIRRYRFEGLFWLVLVANALPVLLVKHFYTGDGPAHLYNAGLIRRLLFEPDGPWSLFFELRTSLIPNLGGHTLLAILSGVFSPLPAEKICYLIIMFFTAMGFRFALKGRGEASTAAAVLALPLLQHFCFYIGFQGFSLGLALMLIAIGYHRSAAVPTGAKHLAGLATLLLLCALCHPVPAVVFMMYWAGLSVMGGSVFRKGGWKLTLPLLPACALILSFVGSEAGAEAWQVPDFRAQWAALFDFQALIAHNLSDQAVAARLYVGMLALGTLGSFIWRKPPSAPLKAAGITALLLLLLYFVTPESWATGGFIHVRLLLCALLFWALWLGGQFMVRSFHWRWLLVPAVLANAHMVHYNLGESRYHDARAAALMEAVEHIPEGAVLVPLNYSQHWLHYNIGLYPSALKMTVNLDNYEAYEPHFPVRWREGAAPDGRLGPFGATRNPDFALEPYESETGLRIEAVLCCFDAEFAEADSTTRATRALLEKHFTRTAQGEAFSLWLRNPE